ncbi:MAG TPA: putative thioesterase [Cyanobacteria bacterium UBA8803]|nr:putative thioesterase [Cyanobacteria bacterium UBA9273]HBL59091.1 putative thioesterase [Cyanobacteria bacterium UBA8803]
MKNYWLKCNKPNPHARLRLFCFPYAGGGASVFRSWSDRLTEIEVWSIQPPGRESRLKEPLFTDISPLINSLLPALIPHLNVPFAFFGHSLGALVVFDLARHLRRYNYPTPLHLFVSGRQAPHVPDPDPPIYQLPDPELVEELRRYNGTPDAVLQNPELMDFLLPILRADLAIDETYIYTSESPLDLPISVFGGLEDRKTPHPSMDAWREQTTQSFTLRMFPGGHFFIKEKQELLLQYILDDLKQNVEVKIGK